VSHRSARSAGARPGAGAWRGALAAHRAHAGSATNLLDDLLVPALNGAVALPQRDGLPVRVCEHLDLDVPRTRDEALDKHSPVTERLLRLALRGFELGRERVRGRDHAHALPAAAVHGLDQDGIACVRVVSGEREPEARERRTDAVGFGGEEVHVLVRPVIARDARDAGS
jgi:hypothetical protein